MENKIFLNKTDIIPFSFQYPRIHDIGINFYSNWKSEDGFFSLPPSISIRINYIVKGCGYYASTMPQTDDIVVFGSSLNQMFGHVKDFAMRTIEMKFSLFYRLTGVPPTACQIPLVLKKGDPVYSLLIKFFELPVAYWEIFILYHLRKKSPYLSKTLIKQLDRITLAMKAFDISYKKEFNFIADQMGVSYRQLQRDFNSFLGLSPKEYERMTRFYYAADKIKNMSLADTALSAGYYDQSHMIKEFKRLSGRTPLEIKQLEKLELPQKHIYIPE